MLRNFLGKAGFFVKNCYFCTMFIVIEGLDGAGKSTQVELVQQMLQNRGYAWQYVHFPRFDAPYYGDMIARFLRGELGELGKVDPQIVAMLYAGDRADAAAQIREWLDAGKVVIVDRYVLSNIAYQCAKISDEAAKEALKEWIFNFEYSYNDIPKPDLTLFLDVPFKFTQRKLTEARQGGDRSYLNGKADIHEASLALQYNVRNMYLNHSEPTYKIIDCGDPQSGDMLPIDAISRKIIDEIETIL